MAVLFPDLEPLLVDGLRDALAASGRAEAAGARVATRKAPADLSPRPTREVVLTAAYGATLDKVRREANVVIEVYADDYATASALAVLVAALVPELAGDPIKKAEINLGPIRLLEESEQEKRSMTAELIVKGSAL